MKRYFITILAGALAIVSLYMFITSPTMAISAGPGNGKNSKVTDLKELSSVLNFIDTAEKEDAPTLKTTNVVNLSSNEDNTNDITMNEHSSMTYVEDITVSKKVSHKEVVDYSYDSSGKTMVPIYSTKGSLILKYKKNKTSYVTTSGSYYNYSLYVSESYSNYADEKKSNRYYVEMNIDIYFEEDVVLAKINKYNIFNDDENASIKDEYKGKWLRLSGEAAYGILQIDQFYTAFWGGISGLISGETDEPQDAVFDEYNNIYTYNDVSNGTVINLDLSNPETPCVDAKINQEDENGGNYFYGTENIIIKNIDNTVIDVNIDLDNAISIDGIEDIINSQKK